MTFEDIIEIGSFLSKIVFFVIQNMLALQLRDITKLNNSITLFRWIIAETPFNVWPLADYIK
jgi:hypothetical protein